MKRLVIIACLVLAGCVAEDAPVEGVGVVPVFAQVTVDGKAVEFAQVSDWPSMSLVVSAETGESEVVETGRADTVIVQGTGKDFALAVKVLSQVCGRAIDPMGFDTQFVFHEAGSDQYWFDGFCG